MKKKMNILICCEHFYPSVGGVQKVAQELALNFSKAGNNVTIATSKHNNFLKVNDIFADKIKIKRFEISGNLVKGIRGNIDGYQNFLIENKFDVILLYAAQQWSFDLVLPIINKIKSNIFFATCGFSKLNNYFYKDYFKQLPHNLLKFKSNILHSKNYIDSIFLKKHRICNKIIIPNASDFPVNKNNKQLPKDKKNRITRILNVSNLRFAKGQDLTILAFFFLETKKKVDLIIYGNRTGTKFYMYYLFFLKYLTELLQKNKKIYFVRYKTRADLINQFYISDIFLFTSRIECSPLVLYESASAGLPFVSFDVGNAKEIAKWTGGGKVKANLFSFIKFLNKIIFNETLLNKMSLSGIANFKKRYNWAKISKEYLKIFKKFNNQ